MGQQPDNEPACVRRADLDDVRIEAGVQILHKYIFDWSNYICGMDVVIGFVDQ